MSAYYNEIDEAAAAHLRALIAAGHIAPGIVDERSIEDVTPADLAPFTQCHFFAGIGIWSHALRAAGIADDTPIWTGSCPCQPFSAAGQGAGFDDERHLWPHFHYLIAQCKPPAVIGEQVASKDAGPWIDLVHTDMEALGYAFGAVPFPTAGIGGPHIRDRLYWVAHGDPCGAGLEGYPGHDGAAGRSGQIGPIAAPSVFGGAGHSTGKRGGTSGAHRSGDEPQRTNGPSGIGEPSKLGHTPSGGFGKCGDAPLPGSGGHVDGTSGALGGLGHTDGPGICGEPRTGDSAQTSRGDWQHNHNAGAASGCDGMAQPWGERYDGCRTPGTTGEPGGGRPAITGHSIPVATPATGPVNGFWRDADWLFCRDGKWRPVEPGTQPLAYGMPRSLGALSPELQRLAEVAGLSSASLKRAKAYRTSALRGYGNAINVAAAQAFIEAAFK